MNVFEILRVIWIELIKILAIACWRSRQEN